MAFAQDRTPQPTSDEETATSRLELVWGAPGIARLAASTVMVIGCGGVGSNCIEALARGGVGTLIVVDGDAVAPSNINRQAIAFTETVGRRKVEVTEALVHAINPDARVISFDRFVRAEDVDALFAKALEACGGSLDFVIDAIDTVSTKLAIAAWAERTATPLLASMGGANKLDPEKLHICDIAQTSHDPLARIMRKECRRRGIRHLTVLSSFEEPCRLPLLCSTEAALPAEQPAPSACAATTNGTEAHQATKANSANGNCRDFSRTERCATVDPSATKEAAHGNSSRPVLGTVSYLPPIMGQMIAGFVIRRLVETSAGDAL